MNARLLMALIQVESGGRDMVVGDGGQALGPLQIHPGVVEDVNRFAHTSYRWQEMTNRVQARKVCDLYLEHYAKDKSEEAQARIWNGGPTGDRKPATLKYWRRVKRHL